MISEQRDTVIKFTELLWMTATRGNTIPINIETAVSTKASRSHWMNRSGRINSLQTSTTSVTLEALSKIHTRPEKDIMARIVVYTKALKLLLKEIPESRLRSNSTQRQPSLCHISKLTKITLSICRWKTRCQPTNKRPFIGRLCLPTRKVSSTSFIRESLASPKLVTITPSFPMLSKIKSIELRPPNLLIEFRTIRIHMPTLGPLRFFEINIIWCNPSQNL